MNKLIRLSHSGIEYLDYVWNFGSGCSNYLTPICPVGEHCWAKGITDRFPDHYPNGFKPILYPEAFLSPLYLKKPSRIGIVFMGDLFCGAFSPVEGRGEYGEDEHGYFTLKGRIFDTIEQCPQHTFLFKTKCPWNLPEWSPFPGNVWVGVTATDPTMFAAAYYHLANIKAAIKYISIEPLLDWDRRAGAAMIHQAKQAGVGWIITGSQTKPYRPPTIEAIQEIVEACDKAGVKVFLKDNLVKAIPVGTPDGLFYKGIYLRQEFPV